MIYPSTVIGVGMGVEVGIGFDYGVWYAFDVVNVVGYSFGFGYVVR